MRARDTIVFAWDGLNRLVTKAIAGGPTVSYGYNLAMEKLFADSF